MLRGKEVIGNKTGEEEWSKGTGCSWQTSSAECTDKERHLNYPIALVSTLQQCNPRAVEEGAEPPASGRREHLPMVGVN